MVTGNETEAPPSAPSSTGARPSGPNALSRFTIAGDVVARACAKMPEATRDAVKWLHGYCVAKNLSHKDVAPMLKQEDGTPYHADSLYHMFTGNREPEQLTKLVHAITRFRRVEEDRAGMVKSGFVETATTRRIFAICRKALLRNRIAFIFGESQTGKTVALEEYARTHNHGETKMFRFPAGGSYTEMLREMAIMLDIPKTNAGIDLRRRIIDCFDSRMLLIADEILESQSRTDGSIKRSLRSLNFLREIHDRKKCGLVLCGTNVFKDTLAGCTEYRNLRQLTLRGLPPLRLPSVPSPKDLARFADAYGLGEAPNEDKTVRVTFVDDEGNEVKKPITANPAELQARVVKEHGLGRWITILQEAADIAREKRSPITWGAVISAHDSFERFGGTSGEEMAA